jgi:NifB/MoaA-like Fe-S oxidoreductase
VLNNYANSRMARVSRSDRDAPGKRRRGPGAGLSDLYAFGRVVHNVSVVPVGLTEFSKHSLVREPTREECAAAIRQLEPWADRARAERGITWAYGADELYLRAGIELPGAEVYGDFEQVENGVGSVRYLQKRIGEEREALASWEGKRIAVLTGTSMGALLPQVIDQLREYTGAEFELLVLENTLFGTSVTCAGLLPGAAFPSPARSPRLRSGAASRRIAQ